jgi:4-amino-4-deoxy-L-arabinose transferase-like glycosyltransferase
MHLLVLALILAAGFALRVWNIDYGLPFVYSIDEASHFTNRAVGMFWQDLDPGYYQNPAAFTYLVYGLLRVLYGPLGSFFELPYGNVTEQFANDPTEIWTAARTLAAGLCIVGAATTYWAARRLWGVREGLVAAAVVCFAFLPVAYSRVAVTDVGALPGVALALYFSVRAFEEGRLRHYALAGGAAGLALAFKYTAGLALLPVAIAALARLPRDRLRAVGGLALGAALAAAVFTALNPYVIGSFDDWWRDLRDQAEVAADEPKPGQESGGVSYYLDSLTWGLGWAAAAAALVGAAIELWRRPMRGLLLLAVPVALLVYLSLQSRYFGRWLLPAYPALAMLAAVSVTRAADVVTGWVARRTGAAVQAWTRAGRGPVVASGLRPGLPGLLAGGTIRPRRYTLVSGAVLAAITGLILVQPLAADVRTALVLGRTDTREQARDFLIARFPPELRVSIEPAVPGRYFRSNPRGRLPRWLSRCPPRPGWREPGWSYVGEGGRRVCVRFKPGLFARPDGGVRASAYHTVLSPEVIDDYRFYGYCLVMTTGVVRERALETGDPDARAYYRRLERESRLLREFSPYDRGEGPVPFSFDLSYNYYPTAYHRPGPTVRIYRLNRCEQRSGPPVIPIPRAKEPAPFEPEDERAVPQEET